MRPMFIICLTGVALAFATPVKAQTISLASAPPVVVKTVPAAGASDINPALTEIKVTYSKAMQDGSWSWSTWGEENYPETTGEPKYLQDGRTCVLPVKLQPNKFYAIWLNSAKFKNFQDLGGRPAVPYLLTFYTGDLVGQTPRTTFGTAKPKALGQTSAASSAAVVSVPFPKLEALPGTLKFHGRYRHRSRGSNIDTPSELWVKESADGGINVLARLPFRQSVELASGDPQNRLTSYQIAGDASAGRSGYQMLLELHDGMVKLTRRGLQQDLDGKELKVPAGAWFDPNSRPDSYCAANILLRAFALAEGETKQFRVYDWDNRGEDLVDYTIQVKHAGKEKVEVPAGTFNANHLVLTQTSSADTWFKKRAGHITDFWVLDNYIILRVLRHREPYEIVLLDYSVPEKLTAVIPPTDGGGVGGRRQRAVAASDRFIKLLNNDQHSMLEWTDRQFRSFFDARTFDGWSENDRTNLETRLIGTLKCPHTREYYQAINTLAALHSTKALPALREIACDRAEKNCRDRWMAIRALGMIGENRDVPELIHLVYHGNVNTRWWAQISLVRLTGQNFAKDWNAWGKWWNDQNGQPPFKPEIIPWWSGQAEPNKLAESLDESDQKFFAKLNAG